MNLLELISSQPVHILWLLSGLMFLGVTMVVGEPSIAALGLAAIITSIAALTVPSFTNQLLIWGVLAVSLAIVMRGMVPTQSRQLEPATEGEVSEPIPAGGLGEVIYEGSLWRARCQVSDVAIAAGQTVYVIGRHGNTLIVLPEAFSDSDSDNRGIVDRASKNRIGEN